MARPLRNLLVVVCAIGTGVVVACSGADDGDLTSSGSTSSGSTSSGSTSSGSTSSGSTSSGSTSSGSTSSGSTSSGSTSSSSSSSSSSSGASDAGKDGATGDGAVPPTWTQIYNAYLAAGATVGHCGDVGCHANTLKGVQCNNKANCYTTLKNTGYINGTASKLTITGSSPLTWFNGNMPPGGPASSPAAAADMKAWVAAGALNN